MNLLSFLPLAMLALALSSVHGLVAKSKSQSGSSLSSFSNGSGTSTSAHPLPSSANSNTSQLDPGPLSNDTSGVNATTGSTASASFAGANNYYIWALPQAERLAILEGMQAAGMKVLRTWVTGDPTGQKGSDNAAVPDLEANGIGKYDDTILTKIDQLMVDAHSKGIKLLIGMYDQNALKSGDIYSQAYGSAGFYTNPAAMNAFKDRINYILNVHNNSLIGNKPWSALSQYVFGWEAQNEPMIFLNQTFFSDHVDWICNVSAQIRFNVRDPNQLIFSGGGQGSNSLNDRFLDSSCPVDVVAIHDYGTSFAYLTDAIRNVKNANKKLIFEEWGVLASDSNRAGSLTDRAQQLNGFKVPWIYWEVISNPDNGGGSSDDFEIQMNGTNWSTIAGLAQKASALTGAPFDFSASLEL